MGGMDESVVFNLMQMGAPKAGCAQKNMSGKKKF